ncbi:unnamed protein product [Rotaria sordida]|uniref:MYND-type domain-containing protein n=1 Tax=Rotaria sordida TaxID=392033 RepID=A0A813RV69_9BILA|nr:unnamed protein product [Rotaria sordida]CAF0971267.1 unnamed protein product [Rotaria sordida]
MQSLANLASNIIDREAFASCTNDFSRISYLLSCSEFVSLLQKSLLDEQTTYLKCSKTSTEYREKGNEAYASHNNNLALTFYNQAIRYAPSYSRELSLAYGNRSATLFNLKYYYLASQDVHRGLNLLSLNEEDDKRRERLEQRLQQCLKNKSEEIQTNDNENNRVENELEQLKSNQTFNVNYPSLTTYADIHTSLDRGRHVVSANISSLLKPGTIILIEQAYASVLLPSAWLTHCHTCLRRLHLILFSCSQCTRAVYCSLDCLQQSIVWHAFECRLTIDRLDKMQLLALRLITKTGWQYLYKNKLEFENYLKQNSTEYQIENHKQKIYEWNNYENILKLETNSHKRTIDDLFQRSIQACIIGLSLINNTSFSRDAYEKIDYQIYICSLILSHLQSLPCNAHEISEFIYHRLSPLSSSCIEIGAGIYATLSLFNHSCNPNVIRNFIGKTVIVRLLSSISSNNIELLDNYGCLSATMDKNERQKKLDEQYHFECQCQPCIEQWPNYDQLPEGTGEKNITSKKFDEAFKRLIDGERPSINDLNIFEEFIAQCDEQMQENKNVKGKVYNNAQEAYKQCLNFFYHSIHIED